MGVNFFDASGLPGLRLTVIARDMIRAGWLIFSQPATGRSLFSPAGSKLKAARVMLWLLPIHSIETLMAPSSPLISRPNIRRNLADTLFATRLDRLFARIVSPKGIILALHRLATKVDDGPLSGLSVSLEEFRDCLDLLHASGFEVVSMSEAITRLDRAGASPRFAVLTFDDGYRDNCSLLLPELLQRRIPATIYLTTGFIDRTAPMWWYGIESLLKTHGAIALKGEETDDFEALHGRLLNSSPEWLASALSALEQRYKVRFSDFTDQHAMDWSMVRDAAASGLVELGAHGLSHSPLALLPDAMAHREMEGSARRIEEETGRPVAHFAYPYGDRNSVSARDVTTARDCGFATAATSIPGLVQSRHVDRHALRRVVLGGSGMESRLRLSLTGLTGEQPIVGSV